MKAVVATIITLVFALNVHAYSLSNMYGGYQSHSCDTPSKPFEPFSQDEYEQEKYKNDMGRYEEELDKFETCLSNYISAAERDIDIIEDEIRDARRELNSIF